MQKNVAGQKWIVYAWDITTHSPVTGDAANITANLRLDGGGANATDDVNPTELEDGYYIFDISRAESNADLVLISPASSTGNVQVDGVPKSVWTNQNIALADRNAALTESRYGFHTWQGNFYYVDPVNGGTHAGGNRGGRDDPYDSIQDCHDNAVIDNNHDVIILVSGSAAGVTTLTEAVTLSKRYLFIRGPGRDFIWTRSGAGDTITVTADGIELSGFQLNTAGSGSGDGVSATGIDFLEIHDVWINATRGDGIHILRGDNCRVRDNIFTDTGQSGAGQGIHIVGTAGTSNNNIIRGNIFRDPAGDAILIEQGTTNNTTIKDNVIEGADGWGINIGASSVDAVIANNCLGNNTSGNINDGGTTTTQANNEQWAKHSVATEARLVELDAANIPTDLTNIEADTQNIQSRLPVALVGGAMDSDISAIQAGVITAAAIATNAIDADALAADAVTEIQSGLATIANQTTILARIGSFAGAGINTILGFFQALLRSDASAPSDVGGTFTPTTDSVQTIRDRGDAAWVGANVSALALEATVAALNNISVADILTTQMTEAYAADGVAPTLAQALFLIQQTIGDFAISGTTMTVKKLDGLNTSATYTLTDASNPTGRTRAT